MADNVARGLVTVALLKVNYDAGHDHLQMYTPFVLDTLAIVGPDPFTAEELKGQIYNRHRLTIPLDALQAVLNRLRKQGFVTRAHGRVSRVLDAPIEIDLPPQQRIIEREHAHVAQRFREFAEKHHLHVADDENALALIFDFLETNEVTMLIEPRAAVGDSVSQHGTRESRVVALFVQRVLKSEPILAEYIQRMLEGLVLQNALLLRDVDLSRRRFKDLEVFFDSAFLFRVVGLASRAYVTAARESLAALRATSAGVSVWTKTIEEMQRVLAAIERLIGTSAGVRVLYRTELVRFLLSERYTPSQVAQASVLIERDIRRLGVTIRSQPERIPRYTLGEADLARRLMRPDQTDVD